MTHHCQSDIVFLGFCVPAGIQQEPSHPASVNLAKYQPSGPAIVTMQLQEFQDGLHVICPQVDCWVLAGHLSVEVLCEDNFAPLCQAKEGLNRADSC